MGDDDEHTTILYKPEQGGRIESGLEPDKPTAAQLAAAAAGNEEDGMDVDVDDSGNYDLDDEFADGGPTVKAVPMSQAERVAAEEARQAAELEAKSKMDVDGADDEIDPLDAFMVDVTKEVKKVDKEDKQRTTNVSDKTESKNGKKTGLIDAFADESSDEGEMPELDDLEKASMRPEDILALAQKKLKKRDLPAVDHAKMNYEPFRKAFYHPPPEIAEMTNEEADALRVELDNIKIRGVDCPKPITKWSHCGLPAVW